MRKIKAWKWENWPENGHRILNKSFSGILMIAFLILLTAGLSACEQIPVTDFADSIVGNEIEADSSGTPQPDTAIDPLINEQIQLSKTAFFEVTPQPDSCHLALAGNPLDASIPDGTILYSGEAFVKIWRVKNAGECAWTTEYSMVWFSGHQIGTDDEVHLPKEVLPGEVIELSVDMIAPVESGTYQSNWKICDTDRNCFGLGSMGGYPFWAMIEVMELGTNTPSPQPTMTPTSAVYSSGRVQLSKGDELDLDNEASGDTTADFVLGQSDTDLVLAAINNAEIAWFGKSIPAENQCQSILYVNDSISLQDMDTSDVLCYKSSLGLTGYLELQAIDILNGKISIEYTTWMTP